MVEAIEFEVLVKQETIDLLDGSHRCHWTFRDFLPRILSRGIYSEAFAARIGDTEYQRLHTTDHARPPKGVWVMGPMETPFPEMKGKHLVGIVVDVAQEREVPIRIRPAKFIALVLDDQWVSWPNKKRAEKGLEPNDIGAIRALFSSNNVKIKPLPIYGTSGDMYWPKRMTHEEIVQMLQKEKEGVV